MLHRFSVYSSSRGQVLGVGNDSLRMPSVRSHFCRWMLLTCTFSLVARIAGAGVDLTIRELRFSNEAPSEGDPVTITAVVRNVGTDPLTENRDVDVWFFEGDPDAGALQIMAIESQAGLKPGEEKGIRARFRPRTGRFMIHAIANPDPATSKVEETSRANNEATRPLTVAARSFPSSTPEQRQQAVESARRWLLDQQGEIIVRCPQDGVENPAIVPNCIICRLSLAGLPTTKKPSPAWSPTEAGPAATSLAILTLIASGMKASDPPIAEALRYLFARDWNAFDVYDLAVIIPALVSTGDRDAHLSRVRFAVDRLVDKQLRVEKGHDPRDDGGWGYGLTADGAHMHYAIYALYSAKQWGAEIPRVVWEKAEHWVRSTQHHLGGWNYNLVDSPWAEGPYGSMTATGLMGLKMIGVLSDDPVAVRGLTWLTDHYTVTSNPGSFSWHSYFLLAIQRAMDTPPAQDRLGTHDWYEEMANYFVASQYPDGRWEENGDAFNTTCFGMLFLSRYTPKPYRPDLSVVPSSIRISPSAPVEGGPMSIRFTLTNFGTPIDLVRVGVFNGDPARGGKQIVRQGVMFPTGRSDATADANWQAPATGKYDVFVVVDPDHAVSEYDRTNNVASVRVDVAPATSSAEERARTQLKELSPNVYQIGTVVLDRNRREVTVPGKTRLTGGFVEYFAVGPLGKVHESVLTLDVEPLHLQTALLALGLQPSNNLRTQGDGRVPAGDPVDLRVQWKRGGAPEDHRAEDLLVDVERQKPMEATHWVFTGSRVQGRTFMADATQSLVATYRDPDAILNHPLPGGSNDEAYRPNAALLPPIGTPVTLLIRPSNAP